MIDVCLHFSKHNIIIFNVNVYIIINNSIDFIEIIKNQVERTEVQDPI